MKSEDAMKLVTSDGREYTLAKAQTQIGRAPGSDIRVADKRVSGQHALVRREGSAFVLHDRGSSNGTFVNNLRLTGPYRLQPGDVISLGGSLLAVQMGTSEFARPEAGEVSLTPTATNLPRPSAVSGIDAEKNPWIAALFSAVLLGGGWQLYLGQVKKAVVLIVTTFVLSWFLLGIPIWLLGMLDAYLIAKRMNEGREVGEWEFFWSSAGPSLPAAGRQGVQTSIVDRGIELVEVRRWNVELNNCGNTSPAKTTVSQALTIEEKLEYGERYEHTGGGGLKIRGISIDVCRSVEKHLKRNLGRTRHEERSIELSAAPHTHMLFTLAIKHVWRKGEIVVWHDDAQTASVPFRVLEAAELELVHSCDRGC